MSNPTDLSPALQLQDPEVLSRAIHLLHDVGIAADGIPVSTVSADRLPDWFTQEAGGWFLRIDSTRFLEGMIALEPVMNDPQDAC